MGLTRKWKSRILLFLYDIYIQEILKIPQKNLLKLINEFSNVARHTINIRKYSVESYAPITKLLIGQESLRITATKKTKKIPRINLTKEEEYFCNGNCETLMKQIETKDTEKWKVTPSLQIRGTNIVEMYILPRVIYDSMQFPWNHQQHSPQK